MTTQFRFFIVSSIFVAMSCVLPVVAQESSPEITELMRLETLLNEQQAAGKWPEAEQTAKQTLAFVQRHFGDNPGYMAIAYSRWADILDDQHRWDEAEKLYQRALALREQSYGRDHPQVANTLNDLGVAVQRLARFNEAVAIYQRALAIYERHRPDSADTARVLHNLASTYNDLHQFATAEPLFNRALAMKEKVSGNASLDAAMTLQNLGITYEGLLRFDQAVETYGRARAIYEKLYGPSHPRVAVTLNNIALVYQGQAKYEEARELYRQALAMQEAAHGKEHPEVAVVLGNLAMVEREMFRLVEAQQLYEQALAIQEKTRPQHIETGRTLGNLGILHIVRGQYVQAEPLLRRCLAIFEGVYGPEHPETAHKLNNLAGLYNTQDRSEEALAMFLRAAHIQERTRGEHPETALTLNNIGRVYYKQGRLKQAEEYLLRAKAMREKVYGVDHPQVVTSLHNLASCYDEQGRKAEAEPLYRQVLAGEEQVHGKDHPYVSIALNNLAICLAEQGRFAEAEPLYNRALAILDAAGALPELKYRTLWMRSKIHWAQDRREQALADMRAALAVAEKLRANFSGGEEERSTAYGQFATMFEVMVGWQAELGNVGEALATAERWKARTLVDQINLQGVDLLAGLLVEEASNLRERDAAAAARVAAAEKQWELLARRNDLSAEKRPAEFDQLTTELKEARDAAVASYAAIRNASPAYRLMLGQGFRPVQMASLREWVTKQRGALLQYFIGREYGYLIVVAHDAEPSIVPLVVNEAQAKELGCVAGPLSAARLRAALTIDDKPLAAALKKTDDATAVKLHARLHTLYELLLPPQQRSSIAAGDYRRLLVVPDGALLNLPFDALVVEQTAAGPKYLLDVGPTLITGPSATLLFNLAKREQKKGGAANGADQPVLSVGNPAYGVTNNNAKLASGSVLDATTARARYAPYRGALKALPHSGWETAWLAESFDPVGLKTTQLLGTAATESAVRRGIAGKQIVHLACHGLCDQTHGNLFGALALSPNVIARDTADDGFLTLAEIYSLNLAGCELAILSACETNLGPQQEGEGVFALSRGFLVAGARRVVASNWVVDDESSASLVSYFASAVAKQHSAESAFDYATALHAAKKAVRKQKKWQHPFYWGAFVLVGPG